MKVDIPKGKFGRVLTSEPVILITTVDSQGRINAAAFGSYTRVSPLILVAIYPAHHTYSNLKDTGEFVVNLPGKDLLETIMIFGRDYPEGVNEIEKAGLTSIESSKVKPPKIAECKAHVECRVKWERDVGSHMLVAGEMVAASCDEGYLDKDGYFDVVKAGVLHIVRYPRPIYICADRYIAGKTTMDY